MRRQKTETFTLDRKELETAIQRYLHDEYGELVPTDSRMEFEAETGEDGEFRDVLGCFVMVETDLGKAQPTAKPSLRSAA